MFLQRLQFILYFLLLILIPKCYAPPIQQEDTQVTSKLPVVSILEIVLFCYTTHVLTTRPRDGPTSFDTMPWRIFAILYPCSGIFLAVGSMFKALYDDGILGISSYNSLLKYYDKEEEEDSQTALKTKSSDLSLFNIPSAQKSEKDKDNNAKASESYKLRSRAIRLRDRLVNDQRAKNIHIEEHDNSAYLAAFLHVLGPEKAKKTKHCILNGYLIIGYENEDKTLEEYTYCLTDEITITGPGATCKYQREIMPYNVRYLSTDMINKLESAHNTDETSYIEICVTLGQLLITTISCMDINEDRWVKVIMIIYTAMAILQSTSLIMLHKQTAAFSIKDDQELLSKDGKYILTEDDRKLLGEFNDVLDFNDIDITIISMLLGIIVSLIIGIWGNYDARSITEWLVLSWILSPFPVLGIIFIGHGINLMCKKIPTITIYILFIVSVGGLIAATIAGYL